MTPKKDNITEDGLKEALNAMFDVFKPKSEAEEFQRWKDKFNENTKDILKDIFSGYFSLVEGSACSVDKARTTSNRIIKSVKEGKNIQLQYTYIEYRDNGGDLGGLSTRTEEELNRICYWCPRSIKDTREAINIYFTITNLNLKRLGDILSEYNKEKTHD